MKLGMLSLLEVIHGHPVPLHASVV